MPCVLFPATPTAISNMSSRNTSQKNPRETFISSRRSTSSESINIGTPSSLIRPDGSNSPDIRNNSTALNILQDDDVIISSDLYRDSYQYMYDEYTSRDGSHIESDLDQQHYEWLSRDEMEYDMSDLEYIEATPIISPPSPPPILTPAMTEVRPYSRRSFSSDFT